MLMEVKNNLKIMFLSVKYNIMRAMENRVSFFSNITFMILNNATFIIQWLVLYNLKSDIGGIDFKGVLILWAIAAGTYGFANLFFKGILYIPQYILNGGLDTFLVQPKSTLLLVATSKTDISAIGDLIYGVIVFLCAGCTFTNFLLFIYLIILGGLIFISSLTIASCICFYIPKSDAMIDAFMNLLISFATYPEGIFKNSIKLILYTLVPVGLYVYMPLNIILNFNLKFLIVITLYTIGITTLAFATFNHSLKEYTSSNLVNARI